MFKLDDILKENRDIIDLLLNSDVITKVAGVFEKIVVLIEQT